MSSSRIRTARGRGVIIRATCHPRCLAVVLARSIPERLTRPSGGNSASLALKPRPSAATGRARCLRPTSRGCGSGHRTSGSLHFPVSAQMSSPPSPRRSPRHLTSY